MANLAHILLALHWAHGWDLADAYAEVARRTQEQVGWEWGGGIYFNYAFALVWMIDAASWWVRPLGYERRPVWLEVAVQSFFLFMFFNATTVFGLTPAVRVYGFLACLASALALWKLVRRC